MEFKSNRNSARMMAWVSLSMKAVLSPAGQVEEVDPWPHILSLLEASPQRAASLEVLLSLTDLVHSISGAYCSRVSRRVKPGRWLSIPSSFINTIINKSFRLWCGPRYKQEKSKRTQQRYRNQDRHTDNTELQPQARIRQRIRQTLANAGEREE